MNGTPGRTLRHWLRPLRGQSAACVVDTNVLVRILARDDLNQVRKADAFMAAGAWLHVLALAEAVWVLSTVYRRDRAQISTAISRLLDHKDLVLQDRDVVMAALDLFRSRPALEFTDCLLLEAARKAGNLPLGTLDRNLGKVQGARRL